MSAPKSEELERVHKPPARLKIGGGREILVLAILSIFLAVAPFGTYRIAIAFTSLLVSLLVLAMIPLELFVSMIAASMAGWLGSRYLREMDNGIRDTHDYKAIKFGHDTGWIVLALLALGLLIFCVWFGIALHEVSKQPVHFEI